MNHTKIFKGWSLRDASSELVPQWYKTFLHDHRGRVEMKKPTSFSNKSRSVGSIKLKVSFTKETYKRDEYIMILCGGPDS